MELKLESCTEGKHIWYWFGRNVFDDSPPAADFLCDCGKTKWEDRRRKELDHLPSTFGHPVAISEKLKNDVVIFNAQKNQRQRIFPKMGGVEPEAKQETGRAIKRILSILPIAIVVVLGSSLIAYPFGFWLQNPHLTQMQLFLQMWGFLLVGGSLLIIGAYLGDRWIDAG